MRYLTDRKRAMGRGAAHTGTQHHWAMQVSSVALATMVPVWIYIFGNALGARQRTYRVAREHHLLGTRAGRLHAQKGRQHPLRLVRHELSSLVARQSGGCTDELCLCNRQELIQIEPRRRRFPERSA